jgi:hypothetical protein
MSKVNFKAELQGSDFTIKVKVDLIEFKEDNINYIYCPALNLYGYDHTKELARESFNTVLKEYFRYTTNKNTFEKDLKKLGWKVKGGKNPIYKTPDLNKLLVDNEEFVDIINNHDYSKVSQEVEVPVNA